MKKILEIKDLIKSFGRKGYESRVLRGISMDIYEKRLYRHHGAQRCGEIHIVESSVDSG